MVGEMKENNKNEKKYYTPKYFLNSETVII